MLLLAAVVPALTALISWVYSLLTNPIQRIPGPWYTHLTGDIVGLKFISAQRPKYIDDLHNKYGRIVRIGPTEVSIKDTKAAERVFRTKGEFVKAKWYDGSAAGMLTIFSTRDVDLHRRYRRLLSGAITESGLVRHTPVVDSRIRLAIQRMQEEMESRGATDVFQWFFFMATDIIGELSFGESFKMLETGKKNEYIETLQAVGAAGALRNTFPKLSKVAEYLPIPWFSSAVNVRTKSKGYAAESLQRHYQLVEEHGEEAKPTLLSKLYKAGEEGLQFAEVVQNATTYIIAGSDTTANILTYLVWLICRHPEVKEKLLAELSEVPDTLDYSEVKGLPYLNQTIEEALRLYASVGIGLPREVPTEGYEFDGYYIPAGYTVSVPAYSLHRDPAVFTDPLRFNPSRWENPSKDMKTALIAFGGGSRICIGLHLARMELRLALARFWKTFPNAKVSTREGFRDQDMEHKMFLLSAPKGLRCLIELH
ncbi:cytochrome protein [Xylariales sp. PMI_506]|nr:cytochrome protein [Xylariales sp. PMI_506]